MNLCSLVDGCSQPLAVSSLGTLANGFFMGAHLAHWLPTHVIMGTHTLFLGVGGEQQKAVLGHFLGMLKHPEYGKGLLRLSSNCILSTTHPVVEWHPLKSLNGFDFC